MNEHSILFTPEHVISIREGRKSQTRRAITPPPPEWAAFWRRNEFQHDIWWMDDELKGRQHREINCRKCPYGQPGDRLWVKEKLRKTIECGLAVYGSTNEAVHRDGQWAPWEWGRSSLSAMYMPRWACRLLLEITAVRVERVQEISAKDVEAEGIKRYRRTPGQDGGFPDGWEDSRPGYGGSVWIPSAFKSAYGALWDSINGQREGGIFAWENNPWVWVLEFKEVKPCQS